MTTWRDYLGSAQEILQEDEAEAFVEGKAAILRSGDDSDEIFAMGALYGACKVFEAAEKVALPE